MKYHVISKVKGISQRKMDDDIQQYIKAKATPPISPDAWCDHCRDFANAHNYKVSFVIDYIYMFTDGTNKNAIITTFSSK